MRTHPARSFLVTSILVSAILAAPGLAQDGSERATLPEKARTEAVSTERALRLGVKLLLQNQESYRRDRGVGRLPEARLKEWQAKERERLQKLRSENGPGAEWPYEGVHRVRGAIPGGYRVGGSAIVCLALVQSPGFDLDRSRQAAVARSITFMLDLLDDDPHLAPGPKRGYDVRGWGHSYALKFFLLAERRGLLAPARKIADVKTAERVKKMIPHLLKCVEVNQASAGGWNYAGDSCSPFMTGSTLLTLFRARAQGHAFDSKMVDRALGALRRAREKTGAYVYSGRTQAARAGGGRGRRRGGPTAMPGACARAAIAELCLFHAGMSDAGEVRVAVDAFFEYWDELLKRKSQQGTHVGPYSIAPYYFMYGHTYAALAIEALPKADRPALRTKMRATLWKTREADGGWNDRIFPRSGSYSTAMAMLALLAPTLDPIPDWSSATSETTETAGTTKPTGDQKKR